MPTPIDRREGEIILKLRELPEDKMAEVLAFVDFLRTRIVSRRKKEGEEYSCYLAALRKKIQDRGGLAPGETQGKRLEKLRRTRESVWKENYENHFRH